MTHRASRNTALVFLCLYSALFGAAVAVAICTRTPYALIGLIPIATGLPQCVDVLKHERRISGTGELNA